MNNKFYLYLSGILLCLGFSFGTQAQSYPYSEDFETFAEYVTPPGWSTSVRINTGLTTKGIRDDFSTLSTVSFNSPEIGPVTTSSAVQFTYRLITQTGYPAVAGVFTPTATDLIDVLVSTDGGTTYDATPLYTISSTNHTPSIAFAEMTVLFPASYATKNVKIKFATRGSSHSASAYFELDAFKVLDIANNDASVTSLTVPAASTQLTANETVTVTVKNAGLNAQTSIPLKLDIAGPSGTVTLNQSTGNLASQATEVLTFTGVNLLASGAYTITATTELSGDEIATNNSKQATTEKVATISTFPYAQGFESGAGGWAHSTTASTGTTKWELGTPAQSTINAAHGGANAWMTDLDADYATNTKAYLVSPPFNFTSLSAPQIKVWVWVDCESGWDAGELQASTNGGTSWAKVGGASFYNSTSTSNSSTIAPPEMEWQ